MGALTDAAGHLANSDIFSAEYNGKIYVDDVLEHDIFASVFMNTTIPAGDHRIRVVTDIQRKNLFWQLSTGIKTEWTFESAQPQDFLQVLPMLGIDYVMPLSSTNSAPGGPVRLHRQVLDAGHRRDAADRQAERRHLVGRRPDLAVRRRPGAATPPARSRCATRPADTPASASRPRTPQVAR